VHRRALKLENLYNKEYLFLRIAYISDQSGPHYIGGYETRLWLIAKHMAERGHDVHVYTSCEKSCIIDGVTFHRVMPKVNYFATSGFRLLRLSLFFAMALLLQIRNERFDVVDANSIPWLHLPSSWLLAKLWRAKFIVSAHEAFTVALTAYFDKKTKAMPRFQANAARAFYCWTQNLADVVISTSPLAVDGLRSEGIKRPIVTVTTGEEEIPPNELQFDRDGEQLRVVFTGRLVQMKRLDILIQAMNAKRSLHLDIVGDGPLLEQLKRYAADEAPLCNVSFHGRVSVEKKREILTAASIFVMPSYREGWSLSTLEAMAHGCAPIFGVREDKYKTGILAYATPEVDSLSFDGSAADLSEKLTVLAENPDILSQLRREARRTAARYSWPNVLDSLETAYAAV
jgi:glycosyltransferase involved in cell wall biosynthesis